MYILSNLLRVITIRHGQCDRIEGVYSRSSKPDERCIGRYELFSLDPHLLECWVIEDINRAFIIN